MSHHRKKLIKHSMKRAKSERPLVARVGFWICLLGVMFAGACVWLLFFFDEVQANHVVVNGGNADLIEQYVRERLNKPMLTVAGTPIVFNNLLFVSPASLRAGISGAFPDVFLVTVSRRFPDTVVVTTKLRSPIAEMCNGGNCKYVDAYGVLFPMTGDSYPVIQSNAPLPADGQTVFDENTMLKVSEILSFFRDKAIITVSSVAITVGDRADLVTQEGWKVYFSLAPKDDITSQIKRLALLLQETLSETERGGLSYIDLRFTDRAYYQ